MFILSNKQLTEELKRIKFLLTDSIKKSTDAAAATEGLGGSLSFDSLSNKEVKQIANALSTVDGFAIRFYSYDLNGTTIPMLINNKEKFSIPDTNWTEKQYYPIEDAPINLTIDGSINLNLENGEYIYIYAQIDNGNGGYTQKLFKNFDNDFIGTFNTGAYLEIGKQNYGNDLILASPYNFTFENQTSENVSFTLQGTYIGESVTGTSASIQPYTNWDDCYPRFNVDLKGSSSNLVFELWKADGSQKIYTSYAYSGSTYVNGYIGQARFSNYSTRDYKIIVKNQ